MSFINSGLGYDDGTSTTFTTHQNRAALIAGLTCACISVLATLITLRWFVLMKRTFRHQLIMFLIISDTFKAFSCVIFPVVVFNRGPINSSSAFCQASGFFLAVGIEASDFAILMIALHSILYIFHPPARSGDSGGLWRGRRYIYPFWIALPIIAASLAFINDQNGYTASGTFCYLPPRPFWYQLALSWIPRYCTLALIFTMYTAVYIYVTLKFRSFSSLADSDSSSSTNSISRRSSMFNDGIAPDEPAGSLETPRRAEFTQPAFSRSASYNPETHPPRPRDPWDDVFFITSKPLRGTRFWRPGSQAADFAPFAQSKTGSDPTLPTNNRLESDQLDPFSQDIRKVSGCPTTSTQLTDDTIASPPSETPAKQKRGLSPPPATSQDPLWRTRRAVRKQLRYLFVYPAVYVLMWIFPFVSHCLLYNDYYVHNQIYWLTVAQVCSVSLQAAADCIVFSWREKPWRRVPEKHGWSFSSFSLWQCASVRPSAEPPVITRGDEEQSKNVHSLNGFVAGPSSRAAISHWWEAEGKKRKDSIWLGTDTHPDGRRDPVPHPHTTARPEDVEGEWYHHDGRLADVKNRNDAPSDDDEL